MILNKYQKRGMARAIVNSRELCGNEMAALKQYCNDYNLPFPTAQLGSIRAMADSIWTEYKKEAGVDPKYS